MKGEAKEFRPKGKGVTVQDTRDRCGKLILTAEDDNDAALMAILYRCLYGVCVKDRGARRRLYMFMREQVDDFDEPEALKELCETASHPQPI